MGSLKRFETTNEALYTVLESFPDEAKAVDGRSWLPLHFAVSLEEVDPADIGVIFSSNPDNIKVGSGSELLNPCHLFAMSKNPNLVILQQLKVFNSRMGQSKTLDGDTPLHLAAGFSNSVPLIKELIQIHPPALRILNKDGHTPFDLVFHNNETTAPSILQAFLEADLELLQIRNEQQHHQLPIHHCVQKGKNPNVLEFLSIILQANQATVNSPTSQGLLPAHIAARYSPVEVIKMLYENSKISFREIVPDYGSVAHQAVVGQSFEVLKYIHSIHPELMLMADNHGRTPLHHAVGLCKHDFIKKVYALGPAAVSKVDSDEFNLLHLLIYRKSKLLESTLSDAANSLRFLIRCFPEGITALNRSGKTPYDMLLQVNNPHHSYARRLLLMYAEKHNPTSALDMNELRRLNYEERKLALFAFFASASELNIFQKIRWALDGSSLMRLIVRFL